MSETPRSQQGATGQGEPDVVQSTQDQQRLGTSQSRIQNDDWKEKYQEMNRAMLLEKLVQARKYKDKRRLEKSIKGYQESGQPTENCEELEEAEKLLDIIKTKEALIAATKNRDEHDIELLISSIEENEKEVKKKCKEKKKKFKPEDGYKHHLSYEISEARKVVRVAASGRNKNRQSVPVSLKMDRNTMSEIKRYSKPPALVHPVMQASLLLLGEDEDTTEEWSICAKMANPDGRQGMNRRIQTLDTDDIQPEICSRAKQILEDIDFKKLQVASAGGAAFYIWAMGTIDEYEQTHPLDGVEPASREKQRELLGKPPIEEKTMFIPKINTHRGQARIDSRHKPQSKPTEE